MKTFSKHLYHYTPLIGILVAGVLVFVLFPQDRRIQLSALLAVSISYVAWGVIHHYLHKDLYLEVVLEYALTAFIGFIVLASLLV